jgi:hypothetical protein
LGIKKFPAITALYRRRKYRLGAKRAQFCLRCTNLHTVYIGKWAKASVEKPVQYMKNEVKIAGYEAAETGKAG